MDHAEGSKMPGDDRGPIVLGVAGGIGSGKSSVARAFGELGWVVVESDALAAAAMARPDVRQTLLSWWGPSILGPTGEVDRKAVGRLVFTQPDERRRLEALIHPLIALGRRQAIEASRLNAGAWPTGIVYDAPLLFEAGLDKECDAVVFVDAPREERLRRVRESRGWDDAELARREAAQGDLAQKKAACRFVINNAGDPRELLDQAGRVAAILLAERDRRSLSRPTDNRPSEG